METSGNTSLLELISEGKRKKVERLLVLLTGPDEAVYEAALDHLLECKPVRYAQVPQATVSTGQDSTASV